MAIELTIEEILQGGLSLIFIIISLIIGIKLLLKYRKNPEKTVVLAGLTWIFIVSPWFNTGFNFLIVLITGNSMSDLLYFLVGYIWPPVALYFWLSVFTLFLYEKRRKMILSATVIQGIIYEIFLLFFAFTDLTVVGQKVSLFNDELSLPFSLYMLGLLVLSLITGILFGRESLKADSEELKLKGKFITIAWISFFIGAIFDAGIIELNPLILIIVRILLISSAIEFYFGFFLPRWIKDVFIK
jgi:hypothetical protein